MRRAPGAANEGWPDEPCARILDEFDEPGPSGRTWLAPRTLAPPKTEHGGAEASGALSRRPARFSSLGLGLSDRVRIPLGSSFQADVPRWKPTSLATCSDEQFFADERYRADERLVSDAEIEAEMVKAVCKKLTAAAYAGMRERPAPKPPRPAARPAYPLVASPSGVAGSPDGVTAGGIRPLKRRRCLTCEGCRAENCGECGPCRDMPKFGGPGTQRQSCVRRRCLGLIASTGLSPFVAGGMVRGADRAPTSEEEAAVLGEISGRRFSSLVEYLCSLGGDGALVEGWATKTERRMTGNSAGTFDTYFFAPNGAKFRSRVEAARHLGLIGNGAPPPKVAKPPAASTPPQAPATALVRAPAPAEAAVAVAPVPAAQEQLPPTPAMAVGAAAAASPTVLPTAASATLLPPTPAMAIGAVAAARPTKPAAASAWAPVTWATATVPTTVVSVDADAWGQPTAAETAVLVEAVEAGDTDTEPAEGCDYDEAVLVTVLDEHGDGAGGAAPARCRAPSPAPVPAVKLVYRGMSSESV